MSNKEKPEKARLFTIVSAAEAKNIPYPYVFVNDDGSVRELHESERNYLETPFHPADGARPYIKKSYDKKDGWGSVSGYCRRDAIPFGVEVNDAPLADPTEDDAKMFLEKQIKFAKEKGFDVIENDDGTLTLKRKTNS